jgi:hypothetical protein
MVSMYRNAGTGRDVPNGSGDSGNSVFLRDLGLVDWDLGEFTRLLVELDRLGTGRQYVRT